jgi:FMN phosphatase YigB (HAD superfamily)
VPPADGEDAPAGAGRVSPVELASREAVESITFDFGNTLVPVHHADLRRVVEVTGERVVERSGPFEQATFLAVWSEERDRQFAEEVPEFREVDLDQRLIRVLARLRGYQPPSRAERWDDVAAAELSDGGEIAWAVDVYSRAFVEYIAAPPAVLPMFERLSGRYRLAILSNWPLALTIDRFAEAAGWMPFLRGVVVSQRVGTIKPHPVIFRAAEAVLDSRPSGILHIGDDWAADVVGAKAAGWRAGYLRTPDNASPLPSSRPDGRVTADLELTSLVDLEAGLAARGW